MVHYFVAHSVPQHISFKMKPWTTWQLYQIGNSCRRASVACTQQFRSYIYMSHFLIFCYTLFAACNRLRSVTHTHQQGPVTLISRWCTLCLLQPTLAACLRGCCLIIKSKSQPPSQQNLSRKSLLSEVSVLKWTTLQLKQTSLHVNSLFLTTARGNSAE